MYVDFIRLKMSRSLSVRLSYFSGCLKSNLLFEKDF